MRNRKGIELALNTVAIIAMVMLVFLVVVEFFMGGFGAGGVHIRSISNETSSQIKELNVNVVKFRCTGTVSLTDDQCDDLASHSDVLANAFVYNGVNNPHRGYYVCRRALTYGCMPMDENGNSVWDPNKYDHCGEWRGGQYDCTKLNAPNYPDKVSLENLCKAVPGCVGSYTSQ